ncbi:hypothetical protein LIER_09688 [Lithospermum erythrorhizon]|uniref:HXXXD-type acyl-transferase family protein n=1 Tax=Lithospermum erythrorhizon TaxID=34254 RepID=A0AAV3PIJ3_LITER
MGEIHVISTSLVTPSDDHHNSENISISRIELTPWDLQTLLLEGIQKGLLFSKPSQSQFATFQKYFSSDDLIHHLKISFTHTLSFFPLLAGRFSTIKNDDNTTSFYINCNNEGAEFTHAIANGVSIADVLDKTTYIPQIIQSFFPLNGVLNYESVYKPLFGVQVTELDDGVFIGCTMNHSVGDGTAFWHFFNSWSEISRGFSSISKSPVFSRWFPDNIEMDAGDTSRNFFPVHISLPENPIRQKFNPPTIQEKFFHVTKENIAKLKARANLENNTGTTISSFQALLARLWRSVFRCRALENPNQEVLLKQPISARGRIQPCLAEGYFGNAVIMASLRTPAKNLLENGLGWTALEINKVVASHTSESMKKWYVNMANEPKIMGLSQLAEDSSCLLITSSARHSVYTADFGWGKALAVRSGRGNKSFGKITVFPGREEGSIDFEVCLSLDTLIALENDADFMEVFQS